MILQRLEIHPGLRKPGGRLPGSQTRFQRGGAWRRRVRTTKRENTPQRMRTH